jgi:site-specific DNA-adenine methylase
MLYLLIVYAFNNQIRFNRSGEYNLPVGKRDFNAKMQEKLALFIARIQNMNCEFTDYDYRAINLGDVERGTFFYADPPYLITCASYNEQNGWSERDERELLLFLDKLHERKCDFALSNVLESKMIENSILKDWLRTNKNRYRVIDLSMDYGNSNYHRKNRNATAREILVVNYSL